MGSPYLLSFRQQLNLLALLTDTNNLWDIPAAMSGPECVGIGPCVTHQQFITCINTGQSHISHNIVAGKAQRACNVMLAQGGHFTLAA